VIGGKLYHNSYRLLGFHNNISYFSRYLFLCRSHISSRQTCGW